MDKDTLLRKQVHDEVKSLFESKLKEARRSKTQAEEELETASDQWRSERRRLNAEIDQFETALAEAKEQNKKSPSTAKTSGIDPVEVAKMSAAAEERLAKAAREWESERARLLARHDRLERAVADAIEKSNNPLRSTLQIKEQFEQKLKEAVHVRQQLEDDFRKAERGWAEEKLRLTGKMVRLRRSDSSQQPTQESAMRTEDDGRLQELQAKFDAASSSFSRSNGISKRIGRLELQLGGAASAQAKLQEEIGSLKAQWQVERASHQTKIQQMERTVAEISQTREQASSETVNQLRKQSEQKIEEMTQQKMDLSQELHAVSERLDAERARFKAEIEELKKNAEARPVAVADNPPDPSIASEVARIENVIHEITAVIDNPDTELSMVIRKNVEKAELDAYLKGILFSLGQGKAI